MASSSCRWLIGLALLVGSGCASTPQARITLATEALPLVGVDGQRRTVEQLLSASRATVLVFVSASCPCVRRYQSRVEGLKSEMSRHQVAVVGISSNAGESLEQVRSALARWRFDLPLYRDEGGQLAQAVGARSTPTVALIDPQGRLLYRGWVDNERLPGEPGRQPYLSEALYAFLKGRPGPTHSRCFGCAITRQLGGVPSSCPNPGDTP